MRFYAAGNVLPIYTCSTQPLSQDLFCPSQGFRQNYLINETCLLFFCLTGESRVFHGWFLEKFHSDDDEGASVGLRNMGPEIVSGIFQNG